MRPVLKWAGGKHRLAPKICAAFRGPCEGTYFEPFVGSASVFLHRKAAGKLAGPAVLSDANAKLMAVYQALRDDVRGVLAALDALPSDDWQERYYEVRAAFNAGPFEGPEHAARLLWLNRAGFNGLYRENRKGEYNVPVGRYERLALPQAEAFLAVSELLQGVELLAASFHEVLAQAGPADQVYCDPPYVPLTATANFTAYCKQPFGHDEQLALGRHAEWAAARGATVVLSNHDLAIVRESLYPTSRGFRHVARPQVTRAISRSAASRGKVGEILAAIGPLAA